MHPHLPWETWSSPMRDVVISHERRGHLPWETWSSPVGDVASRAGDVHLSRRSRLKRGRLPQWRICRMFQLERTVTPEKDDKDLAIKFDIQRTVFSYIQIYNFVIIKFDFSVKVGCQWGDMCLYLTAVRKITLRPFKLCCIRVLLL
jgi:hypothetical protein